MDDAQDQSGPLYNVQVGASSDFVVGRQTNFNAPVTIITNGGADASGSLCKESGSPGAAGPVPLVLRGRLFTQDTAHATSPTFIQMATAASGCSSQNGGKESDGAGGGQKNVSRHFCRAMTARTWLGVPVLVWTIIALAIVCSLVGALAQIFSESNLRLISATEAPSPGDDDCSEFLGNSSHRYLTRKDWNGLNATSKVAIRTPLPYVVISHTASRFCYEIQTCSSKVRDMQKDTMSRTPPFADIPFNFLVGGDGNIYEGRGWTTRSPHEGQVNNLNIDISFIGDFSVMDIPTQPQVDAVIELLEHGVMHGHLSQHYILVPHNATQSTLSPGKNVYEVICEWEHFQPRLPQPKTQGTQDGASLNND